MSEDDDIKVFSGPLGKCAFVWRKKILVPYTWHAERTKGSPAMKPSHFDDYGNVEPRICKAHAPRLKMFLLSDVQVMFPNDEWLQELAAASGSVQNQPIRKRARESPEQQQQITIDVARIVGTEIRSALTDSGNVNTWPAKRQSGNANFLKNCKRKFSNKCRGDVFACVLWLCRH